MITENLQGFNNKFIKNETFMTSSKKNRSRRFPKEILKSAIIHS